MSHITAFLLDTNENLPFSQKIIKNTIWLFSGQLISRMLRAIIVIYAARVLGVEGWGAFSYALGIATFLTIFSDVGMNALITRESVQSPAMRARYLSTAFWIKAGLVISITLITLFLLPKIATIPSSGSILAVLLIVFAFDTFRDLGTAIARSLQRMELEAMSQIVTNAAIVVASLIMIAILPTGRSLGIGYAIGSGIGFAIVFFALRKHLTGMLSSLQISLILPIIKNAWPFGLLGIMGIIMLNTDIIMIGWLRNAEDVGYYSVAQKVMQLLYVIPALLSTSVFPTLAFFARNNQEKARKILEQMIGGVTLLAVPVTILGLVFARHIIVILFGPTYTPAIVSFEILMLTILIVYPSTLLGNAIFAYNQQRKFILFVVVALIGNIIFNFLLIPRFGIAGSAIATALTQLITNILIWRSIKKINNLSLYGIFEGMRSLVERILILLRSNHYTKQLTKFLIVGTTSFIIDFGFLNILSSVFQIYSGPKIIILNTASFFIAVTNSYFFNKKWTFRYTSKTSLKEIFIYFGIYVGGTMLNSGIVFLFTTFVEPPTTNPQTWLNIAKIIATPISLVWNFLGIKFLVFRKNSRIQT
ncbi:MAG: oligosaccharide flippase family protein [Patescibacteria group bacterium]